MKQPTKGSFPKYIVSSYNTIPEKQTTQSKSGQRPKQIFLKKRHQFSSVQSCLALCDPHGLQHPRLPLSCTISWSLLKHMSTESVIPFHLILGHLLLLLPSIFPRIRVFSNESVLRSRWPKYWNFSFRISFSNEYLGLISFRVDWLDLLAAQGTLKSLLQHHSSKASILWHSVLFIVQHSHPYMTTEKAIALTIRNFVDKLMFAFNMLSSLVITFLPRSKHLLILWLQSPSAVILKLKSVAVSIVSPSICHEVMGLDVMVLGF